MPSEQRRSEIEHQVNAIISNNNLYVPGFDLIQYLTKKEKFQIVLQQLPHKITGVLLVDDTKEILNTNTNRLISINSSLKDEENYSQRMRFICAHEYSHFILHKRDTDTQYAHRDTDHRDEPEEKEADFFARCLLMPADMVRKILNLDFIRKLEWNEQVSFIARTFNVTFNKATQRMVEDLKIETS